MWVEAEASDLVEITKHGAHVEVARLRREMAVVIDAKNAEVDAFRTELDAIVLEIKLLHAQQHEAAALAARKPRPRHT